MIPARQPWSAVDQWVQRLTTAALIALALGLVLLGVSLYPPRADARGHRPAEPALTLTDKEAR